MGKRVREHIRSNVIGYIALFSSLCLGTAYAVERNEIKSKHIGAGQVKTADLGNAAVTGDKLATNSVDGDNVINDSLTGADVDEGSLNLPAPPEIPTTLPPSGAAGGDLAGEYPSPQIAAGAVGDADVADRERRILIPVTAMKQNSPANDNPEILSTGGYPTAEFDPGESNQLSAVTQVPLDRAPGTSMHVRLTWSANGTGNAVWQAGAAVAPVGGPTTTVPTGTDVLANSPANTTVIDTPVAEIPSGALTNGAMIGIRITRDGTDLADVLSVFARLHMVEIRYTATS